MSDDFLDQLATLETPEPPQEFNRQLHHRVNRSLLVQQFVEFVTTVLPWSALHFFPAVLGLLRFTVTGRFAGENRQQERK